MENYKKCTKCYENFPNTSQFFHKHSKERLRNECKKCRCARQNKWRIDNPEYNKEYSLKYYKDNKEYLAQHNKDYRLKTGCDLYKNRKEYKKEYKRNRYKNDLYFKLTCNIRTRICNLLSGRIKSLPSINYLGCSLEEFKLYIELKFENGMSWSNYGRPNGEYLSGWHIDHIRPLSSFDFSGEDIEEQLHKAWHYTNLQPLWAIDNLTKSNKYSDN